MDRRRFVQTTLGATGALCTGLAAPAGAGAFGPRLETIGLQLYTVRGLLAEDFRGTMERVAEIGYDEVELAGLHGRTAEELRDLLDDLGLVAPATHVPLARLRKAPGEVVSEARVLGHRWIVCPYLPEEERTSLDDYRRLAEEFNGFGERCAEAGLRFAYHNHDFEFEPLGGAVPYDLLLEATDPELVEMELDLFWTVEAGRDPVRYVARDPERYPLCHVKDRSTEGRMASVGEGTIDFGSIFRRGAFEGYFVEHDNPRSPLESIATSYRTLRRMEL